MACRKKFSFQPQAEIILSTDIDLEKSTIRKIYHTSRKFLFGSTATTALLPDFTSCEILGILLYIHLNIRFVINLINLSMQWSGVTVLVIYTLLTWIIPPTFAFIYTFLGSYSNKTFLNIWDIVPLFKGVQFTLLLYVITQIVEESVFTSLFLKMIFLSPTIDWNECDTMNSCKIEQSSLCSSDSHFIIDKIIETGIFARVREKLFETNQSIWSWIMYVLIVWIIITVVLLINMKRYRLIILGFLPCGIFIFQVLCLALGIFCFDNTSSSIYHFEVKAIFKSQYCLQTLSLVIMEDLPIHWVTLGCMVKSSKIFINKIWLVCFAKSLIALTMIVAMSYLAHTIKSMYHFQEDSCIYFSGLYTLVVAIPQQVRCFHWIVIFFYFVSLVMWCLSSIVVNIDLTVYALINSIPALHIYRNIFIIAVCGSLFLVSLFLDRNNLDSISYYCFTYSFFYVRLILLYVTTILLVIYSLRRLNGDYYMTHDIKFHHNVGLKISLLIIWSSFVFFVINVSNDSLPGSMFYLALCIFLLSPTLIGIIYNCVKKQNTKVLCESHEMWPNKSNRFARRCLDIKNTFIYRLKQVCKHQCLIHVDILQADLVAERSKSVVNISPETEK